MDTAIPDVPAQLTKTSNLIVGFVAAQTIAYLIAIGSPDFALNVGKRTVAFVVLICTVIACFGYCYAVFWCHRQTIDWYVRTGLNEDILLNYGIDYRVHIIRTDGKNINFISGVCKSYDIDFYEHTSVDRIEHDELVRIFGNLKINRKHIIIAVKGFYRRANLIPNEWKMKIGATHEKYVENFDTNV